MSKNAIRNAVAAGDYARATELFDAYARSLPVDQDGLRELAALLDAVRASVLQERAHAQARLQTLRNEINVAAAYVR